MPGKGRPFVKGQVANPRGRPKKGQSITEIIAEMAGKKDFHASNGTPIERRRALADKLWHLAIEEGEVSAIRCILDRMDGKETLPINIDGAGGGPVPVFVTIEKRSVEEWERIYHQQTDGSGAPSPASPKQSPARPSSSSSEVRKGAGKRSDSKPPSRRRKDGSASKKSGRGTT